MQPAVYIKLRLRSSVGYWKYGFSFAPPNKVNVFALEIWTYSPSLSVQGARCAALIPPHWRVISNGAAGILLFIVPNRRTSRDNFALKTRGNKLDK